MWAQTSSKPSWTASILRPSGDNIFAHQRNQSLCLRTPNLNLHLLGKGFEGPTYGISIKERLSGCPNRSNSSGRCRETGTEDWDARAGYTGPIMNVGPGPRTDISGKSSQNPSLVPSRLHGQPPLFLYTFIHSFIIHSSCTPKHCIYNRCITTLRVAS